VEGQLWQLQSDNTCVQIDTDLGTSLVTDTEQACLDAADQRKADQEATAAAQAQAAAKKAAADAQAAAEEAAAEEAHQRALAEAARQQAEAEATRRQAEAETARLEADAEASKAETARLAAEAEARKQAEAAEAARKQAAANEAARQRAAAEEAARAKQAAAEEAARQQAARQQAEQAALAAMPQNPEAAFTTPDEVVKGFYSVRPDGQRRQFCEKGYCAVEWINGFNYGYRITPTKAPEFFSYCQQAGTNGQRICWTTNGRSWADQPDGHGGWKTVRVIRDGFPSPQFATDPAPVSRRATRQAQQAQFGAAIAGAVIGQILNHIH
jgi:hypothetical protein